MPAEREIKFRIPDVAAVLRRLRRAGLRIETPRTHEMNVLFDLPDGSLRRTGQVFRLRQYGNEWFLTHKDRGTEGRHKVRKETEMKLDDGATLERMLRAIGLVESFRYEKFRTEWSAPQGKVVIDETPIGNFGEIEGPARWIDGTARELAIAPDQYITDSYAVLFAKWKAENNSPATAMTWKAIGKRRR
jgi:adenylate cyclase class 2